MIYWLLRWFLSDAYVTRRYVRAGTRFGDLVSYNYLGEAVGISFYLRSYELWEREYAKRGFKTIPLTAFVASGGYGEPIEGLNEIHDPDEEQIFYAKYYREEYLGRVEPDIRILDLLRSRPAR